MKTITVTLTLALALLAGLVAACNGDDSSDETSTPSRTNAPTESASPQPSPTQPLEEQISEAYLDYWDAYSEALLELDLSLVEDFAGGEQLERIREEIEGFRDQGVALRTVVEHDFIVVEATPTTATVVDEIVNNSFFVDPVTKDPPTAEGSGEMFTDTYQLEKADDQWIVVDGSRLR